MNIIFIILLMSVDYFFYGKNYHSKIALKIVVNLENVKDLHFFKILLQNGVLFTIKYII